ncbi:hypothetical protein BKI52_42155 [marine bacterium AO1-C]|nr:hypothetical protein BKI52_42155 [marine bacterium AO1-C]
MSLIEKYIASSDNEKYYRERLDQLDQTQKAKLEDLLDRLEKAGAKKPLDWALSNVEESIPQFARFLMLKGLFEIIEDIEGNMGFAEDVDESYEDDIEEVSNQLKTAIGEDGLNKFLKSYTKGVMWQVINLIDEGNYNTNGDPGWVLKEVNSEGKITGKNVGGLHESFVDFEEEI